MKNKHQISISGKWLGTFLKEKRLILYEISRFMVAAAGLEPATSGL
jgi:hypothetical protein